MSATPSPANTTQGAPTRKRASLVHAVDADAAFAAYPRPRWQGMLLLMLAGDCAKDINNGTRIHVAPANAAAFDAVAQEVPSFRCPAGAEVCVLVRKPQGWPTGEASIAGGWVELV